MKTNILRCFRFAACHPCQLCPPWACLTCPRLPCPPQLRALWLPFPHQSLRYALDLIQLLTAPLWCTQYSRSTTNTFWMGGYRSNHRARPPLPGSSTPQSLCHRSPQVDSGMFSLQSELSGGRWRITELLEGVWNELQGPAAAVAYEAAQPYSAFYKLLPVLSGTGVGRKLTQQGGPQQQPGPQQPGPQQQGPQQQPAAGRSDQHLCR